jgi:hypothetical protein
LLAVRLPEARITLIVIAAGLVGLLIVLVALISGGGGGATQAQDSTTKQTTKADIPLGGKDPKGLTNLNATDAADLLRRAGTSAGGRIVDAWKWQDRNGRNLVVTVDESESNNKHTLRVMHLAKLETTNPKTLRIMRDPGLPRCGQGIAEFTKNGLKVRDLNSDGVAEVMVGWSSRCGSAAQQSTVRLALLTNGKKYIIRGVGVINGSGAGSKVHSPLSASRGPSGFYNTVDALYRRHYY